VDDKEQRIRAKREAAEKARRMVLALELPEDRQRLLKFADELDAQADALEQEQPRTNPPLQVTQTQVQVQNQQATPSTPDKPEEGSKEK
jgi:hypothetical protein